MNEKKGSGEHAVVAVGPQVDDDLSTRMVESLVVKGDISNLSPQDRARYYVAYCRSLGLNPATQPLVPLKLGGREILYPTRGATDQLAYVHCLNREIIDGPKEITLGGAKLVYAQARATLPNGRTETAVATLPLQNHANVLMACETKAKRRVTLSILGLGLLDETEIESIPASNKSPAEPIDLRDAEAPAPKPAAVRVVQPAPTPITDDAVNAAEIAAWCARIEVAKGPGIAELAPHIDAVAMPVRKSVVEAYADKWRAAWKGADDKARGRIKERIEAMPAALRAELWALLPEVFPPQPTPPAGPGDKRPSGEHPAADVDAAERAAIEGEQGGPVATLEGLRVYLAGKATEYAVGATWGKYSHRYQHCAAAARGVVCDRLVCLGADELTVGSRLDAIVADYRARKAQHAAKLKRAA